MRYFVIGTLTLTAIICSSINTSYAEETQGFFQLFPLPDGEFGQNCGVLEWEWDQSVAGLVAARTFTTLTLVLGHWPSPHRRKQ